MVHKKENGNLVRGTARQYLGRAVSVDVDELDHTTPAVMATATCGETTVEIPHNLSPNDGGYGPMPADHVARSVAALIDRAAKQAAFRENVREQLAAFTGKNNQ